METAILILKDSLIDQRQQLSLAEKRNLDGNAPAKKMRDLGIKNLKGFIADIEKAISVLECESQNPTSENGKALDLLGVTNRYLFWFEDEGKEGWTFEIDAKDYDEAYKKAYDTHGPQVEGMMYQLL